DYRVSIKEAHHIYKKDSPSGTAKKLAETIEEVRGKKVEDIEFIREGELAGDHDVIFDSEYDTIKLCHSAKTRDIFAKGALSAAKWIVDKKSGLFSMQDIM
ncbi:4-hydroxy-tetrahydrodipicolinate reductase, partial [bacterium]|nr:4-hydroxy-tetrahydrodipicolinate reductase [bacterium]